MPSIDDPKGQGHIAHRTQAFDKARVIEDLHRDGDDVLIALSRAERCCKVLPVKTKRLRTTYIICFRYVCWQAKSALKTCCLAS